MRYNLINDLEVNEAKMYLDKLISKKSQIEIVNKKIRSIPLNSYLHVCITLYAIEFGYTLEEAKTLLKRECSFMIYEKNGLKFLKKTSKLNNENCSKFVEWIRNYAAKHYLYIPTADEYKSNRFSIDKEINKHKEYL